MTGPANPFVRDAGVQKPGIIGARWWNHALRASSSLQGRRAALTGFAVVAGGAVLLGGLTVWAVSRAGSSSDEEEGREEMRASLQMQRDYGWNFGATSETVVFNELYTKAYAREALPRLESDLSPKNGSWEPFYARALFQSPEALPRLTLPDGETTRVKPLAEVLRPISTPGMEAAAIAGAGLARILKDIEKNTCVVVDLPGPEAVAFAAGARGLFDPVFIFENWPHPRGVVEAHQTLAAAVYYQPSFAGARDTRASNAAPMFVLDRNRLASYADSANQFDNRYWPKLPGDLKPHGLTRALYVTPGDAFLPEPDDLNAVFVDWQQRGVEVRALSLQALVVSGTTASYGTADADFFGDYPWAGGAHTPPKTPVLNSNAAAYRPAPRGSVLKPEGIGVAPVIIGVGTGLLLGSRLNRNGSWNRASGGYGG